MVCISCNNISVFDTIDARCKHEDVELYIKIKLRNIASCWLFSYEYCNLLSARSYLVLSHPQRILQNATTQELLPTTNIS